MIVSEIMTPTILVIDANASILDAAQKMKKFDVGFLAVVSDYTILGTLTDRDIVTRVLAEGKDIKSCLAKDIATKNPVTCPADMDLEEAAQLLSQRQIHRILVIDEHNAPVGVLSLGDFAAKTADDKLVASILRKIKEDVASRITPRVSQEEKPAEIRFET